MRFALDSEVDALKQIALSLSTFPETEKVVFFGSCSRGDFDGSSDMDMLVVVSDIRAKNRVISVLR